MSEGNGAVSPEQAMYASVQGKLCPVLTTAKLAAAQPSRIVAPDGTAPKEAEAVPCAGPQCMWFTPVADEKGVVRGGNCVISLLPSALTQNNIAIAGAFQHFVSNFKLKAVPKGH